MTVPAVPTATAANPSVRRSARRSDPRPSIDSELDEVRGLDRAGDATEVEHKGGLADDLLVVDLAMSSDDHRQVGLLQLARQVGTREAELRELRHVGVVVADL